MKNQNWLSALFTMLGIHISICGWELGTHKNDVSVKKLLRANEKITRMRKKIDLLIGGINGRLEALSLYPQHVMVGQLPENFLDSNLSRQIESDDGVWTLKWTQRYGYTLDFEPLIDGVRQNYTFRCTTADPRADGVSFREVPKVYRSLRALLDDLLENLPELRADVDALIEVTEE